MGRPSLPQPVMPSRRAGERRCPRLSPGCGLPRGFQQDAALVPSGFIQKDGADVSLSDGDFRQPAQEISGASASLCGGSWRRGAGRLVCESLS